MSQYPRKRIARPKRFPRMRGDEPLRDDIDKLGEKFSPHARG